MNYDSAFELEYKRRLNSLYGSPSLTLSREDLIRLGVLAEEKPFNRDKGTEEWVWITGYKGTDKDLKCRDYQFEVGKQFDMPEGEEIRLCSSGFHLCQNLKNVFRYYNIGDGNRFFEVKALVRRYNKNGTYTYEHREDKMTSKSITFIRELTADEIFDAKQFDDDEVRAFTTEQKELALQTSIGHVKGISNANKLVGLGYSEAFATWVVDKGRYTLARTMGLAAGVSMDVKVLTIAMDIYE
jgi:hypothetical protein